MMESWRSERPNHHVTTFWHRWAARWNRAIHTCAPPCKAHVWER